MLRVFPAFVLPASFLLFLLSCTPESCSEETAVTAGASFFRSGTGIAEAPDSVSLYGIGKEGSFLYKKSTGKKVIYLPLDPATDNCRFVITINGVRDTIKFYYSTRTVLLSKECGYLYFHEISESVFSDNIVDTVIIRNKTVTNRDEENIRIFF